MRSCFLYLHQKYKAFFHHKDAFTHQSPKFRNPDVQSVLCYRGGVPVCFPQFSDFGPLAQHGFARNSQFEVFSRTEDSVSLVLRSSDASRQLWPHDFELLITVRGQGLGLNGGLVMMRVHGREGRV